MRIGIIVPRYSRTAVARNRLKRRLREIARIEMLPQMPALDVVVRAADAAYELEFANLKENLMDAVHRFSPASGSSGDA